MYLKQQQRMAQKLGSVHIGERPRWSSWLLASLAWLHWPSPGWSSLGIAFEEWTSGSKISLCLFFSLCLSNKFRTKQEGVSSHSNTWWKIFIKFIPVASFHLKPSLLIKKIVIKQMTIFILSLSYLSSSVHLIPALSPSSIVLYSMLY